MFDEAEFGVDDISEEEYNRLKEKNMAKKRITPSKSFTVTETKRGKPHWTQEGQDASIKRKFKRASDAHQKKLKAKREDKAAGGRIGLSHGGSAGAAIRGRGAEIK